MKNILITILKIVIIMIISLIIAWILWIIKKYWTIAMFIILPIFLILVVYGAYKNDRDRKKTKYQKGKKNGRINNEKNRK